MTAIAIIGATGQVARALTAEARRKDLDAAVLARPLIDLERPETLAPALDAARPAVIVNAAGYTAVDRAESDKARAHMINAEAPAELARWSATASAFLIHLSTDYVFDGSSPEPYRPDHPVAPLNAYGRTKAAGEALVRARLDRHVIVRTSGVYDGEASNFLTTMLRLGCERDELSVVDDQVGAPTYAADLAEGLLTIATRLMADPGGAAVGTYHLANAGETSWHGFAEAIFEEAARRGRRPPRLRAIASSEWPTPARRPLNSRLDCASTNAAFGVALPHWREALARCFLARDRA